MKKILVLSLSLLLVSCSNPMAPDRVEAVLEPNGNIYMKVGESKLFTAHGIIYGYEYSWSHWRPNSNEDLYSKVEQISADQVRFTALRGTRECNFLGICIDTLVALVVYLLDGKGLHGGISTSVASIHIGVPRQF